MTKRKGILSFFDPKMGLVGALVMASIVLFINLDAGVFNALTAALKQGFYTFLAGGFMMRLTENLSIKWENKWTAYIIAVSVSTLIALTLTYALHSMKGTPKPLASTLPTLLLAPGGFFWWAYRKRKETFSASSNTSEKAV